MTEQNKDVVTLAMTRNAKDFTDAINNILNKKAEDAMAGKVPEIANALFNKGYAPKSGDEQEFVKAHTVSVTDYPVGNEDGVPFVAKNVEHYPHGAVKEDVEELEEVSKEKLRKYYSAASLSKRDARAAGDEKTIEKRIKGQNVASAKSFPKQYLDSPDKAKVTATEEVEQIEEKELTKPEMKKREDIVMALKRKMASKTADQKSKIYAIATAQAKKSA